MIRNLQTQLANVPTFPSLAAFLFSLFLYFVASLLPPGAFAQVATGTPPFGSYGGGPDVINLANFNSHITVPVVHKRGRGLNFNYDMSYDSSIWYPVGASGSQSWQPVNNWGWRGQTEPSVGYITYASTVSYCYTYSHGVKLPTGTTSHYFSWAYHDFFGITHGFSGSTWVYTGTCGSSSTSFTETAADGSGFTISVSGALVTSLTASNGDVLNPPVGSPNGSATKTDRNGNQITVNSSEVFTDTLGTTALTVSGSAPNPITFTYTAPSGANASYTMKFSTYTVQTNFGCSGITEYGSNGTTTANLVSEIDLPDGSKYTFAYEQTPSVPANVTGRLKSVTLPTGGTISYAYSGGGTGVNGITCADGSAATLTRTTPDGSWTYAQVKGTGAASTTTVSDPQGNQTVLQFQGIYETQRQIYQGSTTSGTLLKTVFTCYNGSGAPCPGIAITLPITQRTATVQWPGTSGLQSELNVLFNSFGLVTETDEYDYGTGAPGSLIRKTLTTYANLGNGILNQPATITVQDGSGTVKAQTTYTYDQGTVTATSGTPQHVSVSGSRGNATTVSRLVQGTTTLSKTFTYYDTGTVNIATDVNGAQTTFNYGTGACGNSFPTSISEPLSLSKSMTWNCTGGVRTSLTNENGKTASVTFNDPDFWRANSVTDAASNVTNLTYSGATQVEGSLLFNGGASTADVLTTVDGLGRPHAKQVKEGPSSSTYDSLEADFDSVGRLSRATLPYQGTAGQTNSSAPAISATYDALGRKTQLTDSGGGASTFSYSQNDMYRSLGPAPTGENAKRKQLEFDALGRLTSVCEITSGTGSGTCSQTSPVTGGYWTRYSFDVLNNLVGVTQNAQSTSNQQTRTYAYDGLGRITAETTPESGTVTYFYDSDSTCGTSSGDLVKKVDAVSNTICYAHDALHRTTSITYSGPYASVTPNKYFVYDSATVNGIAMTNTKARIAEAYNCFSPCSSKTTDVGFSYTARGEPSDVYESTPHSGGYYHVAASYWANGVVNQISGLSGLPTITYNVDGEGRVYSVSASSGQNPLSSTTYNTASLPTQVNLGSADADSFSYDANTNRLTQYKFSVNGQSVIGNLTWNAIGTLASLGITDPFNSADAQTCTYTHDDLVRIASANCGSAANQTFSYDAFGNINKSGSPYSFQPAYSSSTNRMTSIGGSTPTYDANGNVTNDFLHTYAWDAAGRPVTIDGVGVTFDALGRMAEQNTSGTYSQIVYAPTGSKLAIMNGQTLQKAFVPLAGGSFAVYNSSGLAYYRHSDWLGSSRFASTPSRTMYFDGAYAPFGEPYAQKGTIDVSFTGMNQDTVSNLYDFPAREYGIQGRWPSPDPAGLLAVELSDPQTLNRYAYVGNNPLGAVDPLGLVRCPYAWMNCGPVDGTGGGGGGGGGCQVDGVDTSCSLMLQMIGSGMIQNVEPAGGGTNGVPASFWVWTPPGCVETVGGGGDGKGCEPGGWSLYTLGPSISVDSQQAGLNALKQSGNMAGAVINGKTIVGFYLLSAGLGDVAAGAQGIIIIWNVTSDAAVTAATAYYTNATVQFLVDFAWGAAAAPGAPRPNSVSGWVGRYAGWLYNESQYW